MIVICCSLINFIRRCFDIKGGSIFILQDQAILKSKKSKLNITFRIYYCNDCFWKYSGFFLLPPILCFLCRLLRLTSDTQPIFYLIGQMSIFVVRKINEHLNVLTNQISPAIIVTRDTSRLSLSGTVSLLVNFSFPLGAQLGNSKISRYV